MVYDGEYMYWGVEGTKGSGDPSADQNIPFNPSANLDPQKPTLQDDMFYTMDKLTPHVVWTKEKAPGSGPFEGLFYDPFLLAAFFTHKEEGGTWVSGDGTLLFDMTDTDDVDTIWCQYRIKDLTSTNHLNKLLKYGLPEEYHWIVEPGGLLREAASFQFLDFATNTQAMSCNNNFHDQSWGSGVGGWANWDNSGYGNTGARMVADMSLTWGGAAITAIDIESMDLMLRTGYATRQKYSSLIHSSEHRKKREFSLTLKGTLNDLTAISEYEAIVENRSLQDLILYADATSSYEKYIKCTNVGISPESSVVPIPEAGEVAEVNLVLKGFANFAPSFVGTYYHLPDPSALLTLSP